MNLRTIISGKFKINELYAVCAAKERNIVFIKVRNGTMCSYATQ